MKMMMRGESLSDTDYCKKIPKQVIKMMMKGESLSDTDSDYCKNSQTSNKNDD